MKAVYISTLVTMTIFLSGCYVKKNCLYMPQSVSCWDEKSVKLAQQWQKSNTIGHTDTEQRRKDFQDCGVRQYRDGRLDLNVAYTDLTEEQYQKRKIQIKTCMREKEYQYIPTKQCIDYDKNEYTGLCN